jgi:hypothetical protein
MMDHRDKEKNQSTNVFVMLIKDMGYKKKKKEKVPQTHTSVWLLEEDLRARLPVLFEGTKYKESNYTGKMCSFSKRCFSFSRLDKR